MSIDAPPVSFKMDCHGIIAKELQKSPRVIIEAMSNEIKDTPTEGVLGNVVDLDICDEDKTTKYLARAAFFAGSIVAYNAFIKSDAPKRLRAATLLQFVLEKVEPPQYHYLVLGQATVSLRQAAMAGHNLHPELREASVAIRKHYAAITSDMHMGGMAFAGVGMTISRLEACWQHTREQEITTICDQVTQDFDPSALLPPQSE